jgi:hypothetical protein
MGGADVFTFAFIGRILKYKGVHLLINAFKRLKDPNIDLKIYGKVNDSKYMEQLQQLAANDKRIKFCGKYDQADLPKIMSEIDIVVVPSMFETFGIVTIEAFQYKTPVIGSNSGGVPEVLKHGYNGFLFENNDVNDLYEKMQYVLDNKHLIPELSKNCRIPRHISDEAQWLREQYNLISHHHVACGVGVAKKRVMLHYYNNLMIPIFQPILDKLKERKDINLAIGYTPYNPHINRGVLPQDLELIKSFGLPLYSVPSDFKPDITVIADSDYAQVRNCGKLIHIGHGVLSKGHFYTDTPLGRRDQQSDIICVPGEYHKSCMEKFITKPIIATGMAKLDSLFRGQGSGVRGQGFKILFAPTFNDELSAIPFVKDRIIEVLPTPDSVLLIKLHGLTAPQYKAMYKNLPLKDSRVIYIEDQDITPYMALADMMISDVSSAMMEFAALDKPVVLFNNPLWHTFKHYNPSDVEYTHRNIGYQVNSPEEMKLAVLKTHRGHDPYKEQRKSITDQLFANKYDGKATERIVNIIVNECDIQIESALQRAV